MPGRTDPAATSAARSSVELRILGPLEALVEGEPVVLGAPKQRALLAHLLLRAEEAVPVERLVDALADELQKVLTTANCVVGLAGVAAHAGDRARAGRLLGITQRVLDDAGASLEPYLAALFGETQATVRAELGEEAAEEAFVLGRADEREVAVAYALEG